MRKNLRMILLSTIVATCGMMFTSCKDYDDDIDGINDRIDKLENDKIGSVDKQVEAIKTSITSLEAAYKAADEELKKGLENQITALNAAKSELEAAIQAQKTSLDGDIQKLTADLTSLSNKVEDYNTSLAAEIRGVADGLATTKKELETMKNSHNADISKLTSDLTSLSNKVEGYNTSLSAKIKEVADGLAATDAALKVLEEMVETQNSKLDADIKKVASDLAALSTKLEAKDAELAAEIKKVADDLKANHYTKEEVNTKLADLETKLTAKIEEFNAALAAEIKKVADDLKANYYTKAEGDAKLEELETKINGTITEKLTELENKLNKSITAQLAEMDAKFAGEIAGLNTKIGQCEGAISAIDAQIKTMQGLIDGKVDQSDFDALNELVKTIQGDVKTIQEQLKTLEGQIANKANQSDLDALSAEHNKLSAKHEALSELVETMQGQIQTMQDQIAGKVDKTEYETFTKATNAAIQTNVEAISVLEALCAGFDEETTIKNYIDEAKQSVVAMIDSYVLKETYESFVEEYGTFKTDIESKVSGNTAKITALENWKDEIETWKENTETWKDELTKEGGTLDQLEERLQTAIDEKTTLAEVKATYNKSCTEFLAGVNGIIEDALKEDGLIGAELQKKLADLKKELTDKIDALEKRVETLEGNVNNLGEKVEGLEGDVKALIGQIQSLVYVPEFADGTTAMPCYTFGGNTITAPVVLKFRVSPATMAAKMAGFNDAGALSLITEEVKTRAGEAPTATIAGVEVVDAATGTFTVSAVIENYPAGPWKAVAIALAVKADIDETGVSNDVVSNFAGVVKAADAELKFALYDAENKKYPANDTIRIPWNTSKADSKREILKDLELKVSLDGGTEYMTLEEASAKIGETLVASTYTTTSTPAKTDSEFEITNVTDAEWGGETYPSVQFATANGTSSLVGKKVDFIYTIKAKLGENEAADAIKEDTVTYMPVKDNVTLSFGKLTLPWTYDFVQKGIKADNGSDTPCPKVDDKFNDVVLTGLPEGADISEVLGGTLTKKITADGEDASSTADFTVAAGVGGKIKITVDAKKYEWGKTYDIEYTYTKDESVYVLSGSIEFGDAPADIEFEYLEITVAYEDTTFIDGFWKKLYDRCKAESKVGFTGNTQFAEAIFEGTSKPAPETSTKLINAENAEPGKDVEETNGTKITAEGGMLKGELKKADFTADGDIFVQTATWTTWYGQKVSVKLTYNVNLPKYKLKPSEAWVKDRVVKTIGEVDATSEKWAVKLEGAVKDYYSFTPASDDVKKTFAKKSVDGGGKVFAGVTEGENPVVTWTNGTTTEKDLEMTVKLVLGENTVVASEDFTIKADDPIKTFEQSKELEIKYENNKTLEIDLLTGISLVDITGEPWILDNGTPKKTPTNQYTAKTVFGMKTGSDATVGIEFGAPTNEDGLTFTIEENKLKYTTDNSVLQKDVTVTIPAKITYWLGEKTTTIMVVLKAAE